MASVQVFGLPATAEVARVLTCLLEKDVEFRLVRSDKFKGEGYQVPEFIRLRDPAGQVTYKEGEKKTFVESRAICRYVAEKYKDVGYKKLLGTGHLERASIEKWLHTEESKFDPASSALVFQLAFAPLLCLSPDEEVVEKNERKLAQVLDSYEERLGETRYLAGDCFTLADLCHLPNSHYLVTKTSRGHNLFASRKNVSRWWDDISSRPSWKKVVQLQKEHPGKLEN